MPVFDLTSMAGVGCVFPLTVKQESRAMHYLLLWLNRRPVKYQIVFIILVLSDIESLQTGE